MNMRLVKDAVMSEERAGTRRDLALLRLQDALCQLFALRHKGVAHTQITQAQGVVDGYMNCLLDLGLSTEGELLDLVATTRRGVDGAATATVESSLTQDSDAQASA